MLGPKSIEQATFTPKDPLGDRFYRNDLAMTNNRISEMKFSDKTAEAKINSKEYGQGVATGDYDNDGWVDLYVTRSGSNSLFRNLGDGTFSETTLTAGVDDTRWTASAMFFDANRDGWLDLFAANGEVRHIEEQVLAGDPHPLRQKNQLFRNLGNGQFVETSDEAGLALDLEEVSRGVARGDLDNDGDSDLIVTNNAGPLRFLLNEVGNQNHWLGLKIVNGAHRRDELNARVAVLQPGRATLWRSVRTASSLATCRQTTPGCWLAWDQSPTFERCRFTGWTAR